MGVRPKNKLNFLLLFPTLDEFDRHRNIRLGLPIPLATKVPWGYGKVEGSKYLIPHDDLFKYLVEAKKHLASTSYRDVAAWISGETGVELTDWGLQKIMEDRMPFDEAALPLEERLKYSNTTISYQHMYDFKGRPEKGQKTRTY